MLPADMRESIRHRIGPFAPWEKGYSSVPPASPPGFVTGPPDFVGIGVQKAGTTWWFDMLVSHPDVHHQPGVHKERHFFAPYATASFGPADVQRYHGWFPRPVGVMSGEWTPDYMYQPWVPPLIEMAAPQTRLLVIVRDPIDRFLSGVAHAQVTRGSHLGSVMAEAVERGFYAAALGRWTERFAAEQILVLQYERCIADPAGELERTQRFLGLRSMPPPAELVNPVSPTQQPKPELSADARRRLVELYAGDVDRLMSRYPTLEIGLWPHFAGC